MLRRVWFVMTLSLICAAVLFVFSVPFSANLSAAENPPAPPDAPPAPLCSNAEEASHLNCDVPQPLPAPRVNAVMVEPAAPVDFDCSQVSQIPLIECEALVAFYNSTNGANWADPDAWLGDNTPCNWEGITCSGGHVTTLSPNRVRCVDDPQCTTYANDLMGTAGGALPSQLGDLSELRQFVLYDTPVSGPIPPEMGKLSKLHTFQIAGTNLSRIPAELGDLSDLQVLVIQNSQLSGSIPAELGNLSKLTDLRLWGNQLSGPIPATLGQLSQLEILLLEDNQLTGSIPAELGNLSALRWLYLWGNGLTGSIPPQLGQLSQLTLLSIGDNELTGPLPAQLGNLSNLTYLSLTGNQHNGPIPAELGQLNLLETLALGGNQLSGAIPAQLGNLSALRWLYLWGNQLTGSIPPQLGQLSQLNAFSLENNQLTGPLPAQLGNLSNLTYLSLTGNQHSGPIPAELGQLNLLETLALGGNQLSGAIPAQLGNLSALRWLYLWSNQLSGSIPPQLGQLSQLNAFSLENNQLSGSIPAQLGNLSNLTYLSLTGNQHSGPIPTELGQLNLLETLALGGNQLSGTIPAQLGNLSALKELYLWSNQLTGSIPPQLGQLSQLNAFSLENNQLSGSIPAQLGSLSQLRTLYLHSNQLSESIPATLGQLGQLTALSLSRNHLTGSLPAQVGNLSNLNYLFIWGNQLSGPIPAELGNLSELLQLSMSENAFSGELPSQLGNLVKLTLFDLANNQVSGSLPTSLVNIPLESFMYDATDLCEPADSAFQAWLANIEQHQGTHICPTGIAAAMTIRSEPHLLRADGVQTSTVTLQVVDVYSNPVALSGQPVTLSAVAGTLAETALTTDANGRAQTVYRSAQSDGVDAISATAGDYQGADEISVVITPTHRAIDVALIIDSSGSMGNNDPNNLRLAAARVFLVAMQSEDFVTVVDFDHWFRIVSPLERINRIRPRLLDDLNRINSVGGTHLGFGLQAGHDQLRKSPFDHPKAAIFLTDGNGTYTSEANLFVNAGWPVYTVSLGNEPDQALLDQIADETGGRSYHLDSPQQLIAVYLEIASRVAQSQMMLNQTQSLQPNQTQTRNVTITAGQTSAVFGTSWQGSTVDTQLIDPNGRVITPSTQDAKISYSSGPTHNLYQVLDPIPGAWKVEIFGADLPDGAEDVTVQVLARSDTPVIVEDVEIFLPTVQR